MRLLTPKKQDNNDSLNTIRCPKLFTGAKLFCIVVHFDATKIVTECLAGNNNLHNLCS